MAADEDVRVRQLRGLGNLYMLALCPEDTPFTLPELQKRSQQEANKRQSSPRSSSPPTQKHPQQASTSSSSSSSSSSSPPSSGDDERRRRRRLPSLGRRDKEERRQRHPPAQATKAETKKMANKDAARESCGAPALAFLEVDVRVSQAKALARLAYDSKAPSLSFLG
jgi:hypothetical protein